MNRYLPAMILTLAASLLASGCAEDQSNGMNKTTSGALLGAGAGAALGGLFRTRQGERDRRGRSRGRTARRRDRA